MSVLEAVWYYKIEGTYTLQPAILLLNTYLPWNKSCTSVPKYTYKIAHHSICSQEPHTEATGNSTHSRMSPSAKEKTLLELYMVNFNHTMLSKGSKTQTDTYSMVPSVGEKYANWAAYSYDHK